MIVKLSTGSKSGSIGKPINLHHSKTGEKSRLTSIDAGVVETSIVADDC